MTRLAICVNPMSGRDVRRLAARATNMTFEAKRDMVARIAAGAEAAGVTDIYVTKEPFRIASAALELMGLSCRVHVLEHEIAHDAADTQRSVQAFLDAGCDTVVTLGGDGTNRAVAKTTNGIKLVPLSTGTNNVFPQLIEPTVGGLVAGFVASGNLPLEAVSRRCKLIHLELSDGRTDAGVIDAVLLKDDHVGNLLPFDPRRIVSVLLTRAEPDAIGMSPIGGYLDPVLDEDDAALLVELGEGGVRFKAPLSPGLFREVAVASHRRVAFDEVIAFRGPAVLALDGDRDLRLDDGEIVKARVRRDGPIVIDVAAAMRLVVRRGMIARPFSGWADERGIE
jgi:hypothetical protein